MLANAGRLIRSALEIKTARYTLLCDTGIPECSARMRAISRYVLPHRRSSSINSRSGSLHERDRRLSRPSRMARNLSSIVIAVRSDDSRSRPNSCATNT
jgi:hypothetical protein